MTIFEEDWKGLSPEIIDLADFCIYTQQQK
ncbi:hypothetical protein Riv7116_5784 [Rivularia sp. PCC 7116]|nr:hypothetical protein Riv7116_5784 [Rivularia sp. PCC 7116]